MMETARLQNQPQPLRRLAEAWGIEPEWRDAQGQSHPVDEAVCRRLLEDMGVAAATAQNEGAAKVTEGMEGSGKIPWLEPVHVLPETSESLAVPICLPAAIAHQVFDWELRDEDGHVRRGEFTIHDLQPGNPALPPGRQDIQATLCMGECPPRGYYRLRLHERESGESRESLIVITPSRCYIPAILQGQETEENPKETCVWGLSLQLYALNSGRNWGIGDLGDLQRVIDWSADAGVAMIGLNSLHALFPHDPKLADPHAPASRMAFNTLYLDIESMEDFRESEPARQLVFGPAFQEALRDLRKSERVRYAEAAHRKLEVLELLYRNFRTSHLAKNTQRALRFREHLEARGTVLEKFGLYQALQERFHREDSSVLGWRDWPDAYRSPDSPAVQEFADSNRERIGFYQYLQWQLDLQLHEAGIRCLEHRLGIGLLIDLAVGTDRNGAETWANQRLYAKTGTIGAPPDEQHPMGQDWQMSPMIPQRMREEGYAAFIDMLRQNMKHAGALRINRMAGLFRLFWIPPETPAAQGACVRYPINELFGILALESQRNRCMVIGGDSGETPETVRERMAQWGIYADRNFLSEKQGEEFSLPEGAPAETAATVSAQNGPTLTGFWEGRDIAARSELDLYHGKELRDRQIRERVMDRVAILSLLERQGLLPEGVTMDPASVPEMRPELTLAIHRLLARSRAKILAVRLEDILQQREQVAVPGTSPREDFNWRRKLALPVEDLPADETIRSFTAMLAEERPRKRTPEEMRDRISPDNRAAALPQATYRFQFHKHFTFRDAVELVPYLSRLGISHCYASPLLTARPGSQHGYDITDHRMLNREIGSMEEFEHLSRVLRDHGMGLVVDIVPNHMGAGKDNPWWQDVLENGPSSVYADYFDIDWHPLTPDLDNKILLAILGDSYGKILENGELKLRFEQQDGRFWLDYYEHAIPINPNSYPVLLAYRMDVLEARLGNGNTALFEAQSIISAFENLPVETEADMPRKEARARERIIALNRLVRLCQSTPDIASFIAENVQDFQPKAEDPTSVGRLHRLLEQQSYRLANWRVASDEINYRRFFDVNDLVALRVEDPRVFSDTHALIMELIGKGLIQGLRIDHPDGLYDPAAYFRNLQQEAARRLKMAESGDWKLNAPGLPIYVLIEKVLAPFERLPEEWAVHGTTGYDFANGVNGLFVRQECEREFTRLYEKVIGQRIHFEDLVYESKKLIMKTTLNSELGVLSQQLSRISKQNRSYRDFTLHNLRSAIMEVVASFPVYRTYVTAEQLSKKDREYIDWAIRAAKRRSTTVDTSIFDFIRQVLLLELTSESSPSDSPETEAESAEKFRKAVIRFAMKFQQYSGPVMAKGLEDTTFYRYNRLVSLNEVGGEPRQFGISVPMFHHQNLERARRAPHTLLATSTHDTKRSEDVRARISVLSEMPDDWQRHLAMWRRTHRNLRRHPEDGDYFPAPDAEYLFYQTLLGIWPFTEPNDKELAQLSERLVQYMLKASREAKTYTSWINPNREAEEALEQYVRGVVLRPSALFLEDFHPFQKLVARYGIFNALSQTLLKLTSPGIPDLYQGTELWDFSLVDPDNRRPVDYEARRTLLASVGELSETKDQSEFEQHLFEVTRNMTDGRIKQAVVASVLDYRGRYPELFRHGSYIPLEVTGTNAEHVVAFARQWEKTVAITVVPRQLYSMGLRRTELPCGRRLWKDTAVILPQDLGNRTLRNALTRETPRSEKSAPAELPLAQILNSFPVALLVTE